MTRLEIGRLGKAHGLKGEITAVITSDRPERTAPGAVWFLGDQSYEVAAIRPFQQKWIVALEGVGDRNAAEALTGQVVTGDPIDDPDALWVHQLVGAEVRTPDGRSWGRVAGVLDNPAHAILELDDGTLVPEVFVVDATGLPASIVVDPPEGILPAD